MSSTFQAAFFLFVLLQITIFSSLGYDDFEPSEEEWESATATFTKEANGSIITGNNSTPFSSIYSFTLFNVKCVANWV